MCFTFVCSCGRPIQKANLQIRTSLQHMCMCKTTFPTTSFTELSDVLTLLRFQMAMVRFLNEGTMVMTDTDTGSFADAMHEVHSTQPRHL